MCDPVSLGSLALGTAAGVGKYVMGSSAASANSGSATGSFLMDTLATAERMRQERIAAATKIYQMSREADKAYADTSNRASEMGVSGNTLQALLGDLKGQEAFREHIVNQNADNVVQQLQFSNQADLIRTDQRIKSMQPSLAGLALDIAGAGLGAVKEYKRGGGKLDGLLSLLKSGGDD